MDGRMGSDGGKVENGTKASGLGAGMGAVDKTQTSKELKFFLACYPPHGMNAYLGGTWHGMGGRELE